MATVKAKSMVRGVSVENIVYDYLKSKGLDIKKTPAEVDMRDHIDFTFYSDKLSKMVGIDVKAPVVIKGYEPGNVNYATFINNQGIPGWLYGKADFTFLVTFKEFVIVKLSELREFMEEKTIGQEPLFGNPKKLYTKFHCSNFKEYNEGKSNDKYRKSVSSLFLIDDVKRLPSSKSIEHGMKEEIEKLCNY